MKQPINNVVQSDVIEFAYRCEALGGDVNLIDQYQLLACRSAIYPGKGTPFGLMYTALGLAEAGEVQNKVKKTFRDDGVLNFEDIDEANNQARVSFQEIPHERREQIMKELGGMLWYAAATCEELGCSLSEVMRMNLAELAGRAQRGTLGGSGDDR